MVPYYGSHTHAIPSSFSLPGWTADGWARPIQDRQEYIRWQPLDGWMGISELSQAENFQLHLIVWSSDFIVMPTHPKFIFWDCIAVALPVNLKAWPPSSLYWGWWSYFELDRWAMHGVCPSTHDFPSKSPHHNSMRTVGWCAVTGWLRVLVSTW